MGTELNKMNKLEKLQQMQAEMPDEVLIKKVEHQISELAKTGGRSHIMYVPPKITDTDMILNELVRRFKLNIGK